LGARLRVQALGGQIEQPITPTYQTAAMNCEAFRDVTINARQAWRPRSDQSLPTNNHRWWAWCVDECQT
jgi:hypothetical protein